MKILMDKSSFSSILNTSIKNQIYSPSPIKYYFTTFSFNIAIQIRMMPHHTTQVTRRFFPFIIFCFSINFALLTIKARLGNRYLLVHIFS